MHSTPTCRPEWNQQIPISASDPVYFSNWEIEDTQLEDRAQLLIAHCHQLLAQMKDKMDSMHLPANNKEQV